jgi:hypothetical protein
MDLANGTGMGQIVQHPIMGLIGLVAARVQHMVQVMSW